MELSKGIKSNPAGVDSKDRHTIKGAYSVIKYMLSTISNTRRIELEDILKALLAEPRETSTNTIIQTCTNFSL